MNKQIIYPTRQTNGVSEKTLFNQVDVSYLWKLPRIIFWARYSMTYSTSIWLTSLASCYIYWQDKTDRYTSTEIWLTSLYTYDQSDDEKKKKSV